MATADLSSKTKDFIRRHIQSVWQLELLLLFKNTNRPMSASEASKMLYMDARVLERGIQDFVNAGVLTQHDSMYTYAPNSTQLRDAIEETARTYEQRRTAVINFIYASPMRSFSDAFKFTSEED